MDIGPLAFGAENARLIASLVLLMGVLIRQYFNTRHAHSRKRHIHAASLGFIEAMAPISSPSAKGMIAKCRAIQLRALLSVSAQPISWPASNARKVPRCGRSAGPRFTAVLGLEQCPS